MRLKSIFIFCIGVFISQFSFSAACPASDSRIGTGNGDCIVTGTESTIQLNFKRGFDDATPIATVGGNSGTTIGAQRKLSFIKAVEILAAQVSSSETIIVDAAFSSLSCTSLAATLGSAGATTNIADANPMPATGVYDTFYPIGLINSLGETDYNNRVSDINSEFNSDIGTPGCLENGNGWYYGFDAPPSRYIGFTTVLLHEMTHGLGFSSLVDTSNGTKPSGIDDIFSNNLYSKADGAAWSTAGGLSNSQRAASAKSGDGLLWNGTHVNSQAIGLLTAGYDDNDTSNSFTLGDRVQMYAPDPIESGSSVSHFDKAASPNEIMEPQYTGGQLDLGLALYLLQDIGWGISSVIPSTEIEVPSTTIEVLGSTLSDGDRLVLSDSNTQINVNNGSGNYRYELTYGSGDVTDLIDANMSTTGFTIGLPSQGEFAGDYTLVITDDDDGDVITITVTRPLRLNWSTKALLNGDLTQTLKIEGGAPDTVYSLVQSGNADLIFRDSNKNSITSVIATAELENYNAAFVYLDSLTVASISSLDVTVQSRYDDVVEDDVKIYPSSSHQFTVKNSADNLLVNATAILNGGEALLADLKVPTGYLADGNGQFTILLPNTSLLAAEENYSISIDAVGYTSISENLDSTTTVHNIILTQVGNSIVLTGEITAQGNQNLLSAKPIVTITYSDDTSEVIYVFVNSSDRAIFTHEVDLNLKSLSLLTINQTESEKVVLNVSNVNQSQTLDINLLNGLGSDATTEIIQTGDSAGGGDSIWFNVCLLLIVFFRMLLLKREKINI